MKTRDSHSEHPALHTDRPDPPMAFDKGIFHFWFIAKPPPACTQACTFPVFPFLIFVLVSLLQQLATGFCRGNA